jgi:hypothetical protein
MRLRPFLGALVLALSALSSGDWHVGAALSATTPECVSPADSSPRAVARLSKAEYSRTLQDLFGPQLFERLPALPGLIGAIPDDDTSGGFLNASWTLTADHISGYLATANELSAQVLRNASLRNQVMPCVQDLNAVSKKCVERFLDTFGARAFRRDLEKGEREELLRFYESRKAAGPQQALEALLVRILVSPHFTFKQGVESPRTLLACKRNTADESFKRASRMSYGLWGSMPDRVLHASASRGTLAADASLDAELARMWDDERTRTWMRSFFRQWLRYDRLPVEGYSAGFLDKDKLDRAHLHEDAIDELDRFIENTVWKQRGSFRDLMTSRDVLTANPSIRRIYGLPAQPTGGVETAPVTRSGLLTRVAIMAQGFDDPSIVKRGALVRRQLLCDVLMQPDPSQLPPGSLEMLPNHTLSTRQRWEQRTSGVVCQGCHRMLNPIGFAFESYDGIGRFRTVERLMIPKSDPPAFVEHPINARVSPTLASRTEPELNGPVELSESIGASLKANTCFVRQLDTFVMSRPVAETDMPAIRELAARLMQPGGSIRDVMLGLVKRHALQN